MCYIDGQNNKYSALNECNRMLKYNINNFYLENTIETSPVELWSKLCIDGKQKT
jgi:hypothetical protein